MMIFPTGRIASFAIPIGIAFVAGWVVHGWKYDSEYKGAYNDLVQKVNAEQQRSSVLVKQYHDLLSQYQNQTIKDTPHVKIEIKKYPVYLSCVLPAGGVQLINAAIDRANQIQPTR